MRLITLYTIPILQRTHRFDALTGHTYFSIFIYYFANSGRSELEGESSGPSYD